MHGINSQHIRYTIIFVRNFFFRVVACYAFLSEHCSIEHTQNTLGPWEAGKKKKKHIKQHPKIKCWKTKKKKINPIFIIILVCMSKYMIKWVCNIHSMNSFVDYIMMILPLYVAYIYCFITLRLHVCVQRQILAKLTCTLPSTYNIISHFNLRVNDRWQDLSNGMILLASGKGHIADPKHRNKKKQQKKHAKQRQEKKVTGSRWMKYFIAMPCQCTTTPVLIRTQRICSHRDRVCVCVFYLYW